MSNTAFKRDIDDPKTIAGLRRRRAVARAAAAAAGADRRRHPRRRSQRLERLEGAAAARALLPHARSMLAGGIDRRRPRAPRVKAAIEATARRASRLDRTKDFDAHLARGYAVLLALLRHERSCPPRRAGAPRRSAARRSSPRNAHRPVARRDRGDDLHRRPSRPVRRARRRHRGLRRQHRRRPHLHPGQRHGARHLLGPGCRGRAVRRVPIASRACPPASSRLSPAGRCRTCEQRGPVDARPLRARLPGGAARADRQQGSAPPTR